MRALIKENIKNYRAKNPDCQMNMKILAQRVFNRSEYNHSEYMLLSRYNIGRTKSYKLEYLFAICRVLDCTIQELIKYES